MKKSALAFAALVFVLPLGGTARAATGSELVDAVRSFVSTGISNADSRFTALRGAAIKQSPGEHYQTTASFGQFFPDCHISGYEPPLVPIGKWVFSCSSPGLGNVNVNQLRGLIYQGVVRGLPVCFTRTLSRALLADEDFRWDCHEADRGMSVDVSTTPTSNGDPSFLLEVYEYAGKAPQLPTPSPGPTPVTIELAKPQATLAMGGVQVPYQDYVTLNFELNAALTTNQKSITPRVLKIFKAGNEMPAYDWVWHYDGKSTQNGTQAITVWVCANLSPQEQTMALKQATLLGLLDSGLGGTILQQAYATARDADAALGAQAADPFANRRKLIYSMAQYFR